MKRGYVMIILMCLSIVFISAGVYRNNLIIAGIGGLFCGIYNRIITKKD